MSRPKVIKVNCGNCSVEKEYLTLYIDPSGSPYLDKRPSYGKRRFSEVNDLHKSSFSRLEVYRYAIETQLVECCVTCGYCYKNIGKISESAKSIIKTQVYINQSCSAKFSNIANKYLCESLILEEECNFGEAAWSALRAAWCCDNEDKYAQARECRTRSIKLFQVAKCVGSQIKGMQNNEEFLCLLVDLYRRCEDFGVAQKIAEIALSHSPGQLFNRILTYQMHLCKNQNLEAWTVEDAVVYYDRNNINPADSEKQDFLEGKMKQEDAKSDLSGKGEILSSEDELIPKKMFVSDICEYTYYKTGRTSRYLIVKSRKTNTARSRPGDIVSVGVIWLVEGVTLEKARSEYSIGKEIPSIHANWGDIKVASGIYAEIMEKEEEHSLFRDVNVCIKGSNCSNANELTNSPKTGSRKRKNSISRNAYINEAEGQQYQSPYYDYRHTNEERFDVGREYFYAMTDGQEGDYEDYY